MVDQAREQAARTVDALAPSMADGMSCQLQLDDLAGVRALHVAELLADRT